MDNKQFSHITKDHDESNIEINSWFIEDRNFYVARGWTYHDTGLPESIQNILSNSHLATAYFLRHQMDNWAIHLRKELIIVYDNKETKKGNRNIAIEAMQFARNLLDARDYGAKLLYICRCPAIGREVGFWLDSPPPLFTIRFPKKIWEDWFMDWFRHLCRNVYGLEEIRKSADGKSEYWERKPSSGGDWGDTPYVFIEEPEIKKMPHWKELVDDAISVAPLRKNVLSPDKIREAIRLEAEGKKEPEKRLLKILGQVAEGRNDGMLMLEVKGYIRDIKDGNICCQYKPKKKSEA